MSERGIGDKEIISYQYDSNPNECSLTTDNTKPMCTVQTSCKSRKQKPYIRYLHKINVRLPLQITALILIHDLI